MFLHPSPGAYSPGRWPEFILAGPAAPGSVVQSKGGIFNPHSHVKCGIRFIVPFTRPSLHLYLATLHCLVVAGGIAEDFGG